MPNNAEHSSKDIFTPDVLDCIANLSSDEVFTPPKLVNQVLDLLPPEIWHNKEATFLDPACKSGVWLREITKRLISGLADEIPDLQERIDHVLHKQVFGIAITELTSLLSRRSLYCSKYPNGKYSISIFDDVSGNIWFKNLDHRWKNGKCELCGASQAEYDRDEDKNSYAYGFIHCRPEYWEEVFGLKFDVIIGNPPYQLDDGGHGASATPIYQKFVEAAKALNPRYLCMIIPARWYSGGKGLDKFRYDMINDNCICELHDYQNASECFPGVEIKGGVCYFLRNTNHHDTCNVVEHRDGKVISSLNRPLKQDGLGIFIRDNRAISIVQKVLSQTDNNTFDKIVSSRKPFGLPTNYNDFDDKTEGVYRAYTNNGVKYLSKDKALQNVEWTNKFKLFIPKAIGSGSVLVDKVKPIVGYPGDICTETYLLVGPFSSETEAKNVQSYIRTKFFHFMLSIKKNTQDATAKVYSCVPIQDFSKPWTDEELYAKYNLSSDEISYIESSIKEMA